MASRLAVAALLTLLSACSTTREVRLDTSQGELFTHVPIQDEADPVELGEDEFILALAEKAREVRPVARPLDAARQWSGVPDRSGWYRYEGRSQRLLLLGAESHRATWSGSGPRHFTTPQTSSRSRKRCVPA
ncbi:hypothetical protein [Hyalangium rubrum]|uniref:Lipoprotein n=1 Tax=Hyalangium rubrum TaxID=3103134 RepID=A0ABU5H1J5_9BACT|nr:hypothetical protein [Hyalangium sp. s54d21]MDY7227330.1 hypothetical protein [Hyalangium sp. s54d21]